jgi:hypothetical protein
MKKNYWDNINMTYGARVGRTTFVGCQDPFSLGIAQEGDRWIFQLPEPSKITYLNASNIGSWQTLIDNALPNERLIIEKGTYHIGNLTWNGKPIQIIGELNTDGSTGVFIDGSVSINPASFVNNAGVWELTNAPVPVNLLPTTAGQFEIAGFYPQQTNFCLWKDGIPYNSCPDANLADNTNNCSYSSNTIKLNSQPTGTLRWGIYSHFIASRASNSGGLVDLKAADGVIIGNIECYNFTGNRNGSVIGRRQPTLISASRM